MVELKYFIDFMEIEGQIQDWKERGQENEKMNIIRTLENGKKLCDRVLLKNDKFYVIPAYTALKILPVRTFISFLNFVYYQDKNEIKCYINNKEDLECQDIVTNLFNNYKTNYKQHLMKNYINYDLAFKKKLEIHKLRYIDLIGCYDKYVDFNNIFDKLDKLFFEKLIQFEQDYHKLLFKIDDENKQTFEFGNELNEIQQKIVNERTKSAEWHQRFINEFFNIYLTSKFC